MIKVQKLDENATFDKAHQNDSGYDLTCTKISYKDDGRICLHLGISTEPPQDHYFQLVPRSSFSKTGFIMANSVGIIDEGYRGEWMMMIRWLPGFLTDANGNKVWHTPENDEIVLMDTFNDNISGVFLHKKVAQAVLHRNESIHQSLEFVDSLTETQRGSGGFGSTDNK